LPPAGKIPGEWHRGIVTSRPINGPVRSGIR
jgi:hypothetical protein